MLLVTVQQRDGQTGTFPVWPSVEYLFEADADTPKSISELWADDAPKSWHYKLAYYAALKSRAVQLGDTFDKWIDNVTGIQYARGDDEGNPISEAQPPSFSQ
jgi:hypothetical protein